MSRRFSSVSGMAFFCFMAFAILAQPHWSRAADTTPPIILSTTPTPGATVSNLSQITIIFSEPVIGVEAEDLQVGGEGAATVTGIGSTNFTFSFTQPPAGLIQFYWDADHGIYDQDGNSFQPGTSWTYNLVDTAAPLVLLLSPPAGSAVTRFTQLEVNFSEPVISVDAGDLLVNGQAAQGLTGSASGPYLFTFAEPAQGTVTLSWTNGHGITDLASNAFVGAPWTLTLNSNAVLGNVVINEFLSANVSASGLRDEDGQYSDWIELYNRGGTPVNLAGWSLSDDPNNPGQWTFPATNIAAGQYLIVFASAKDRRVSGARLHTNFELSHDGEYLGLFGPELPRQAVSEFAAAYPAQRNDYSYGYDSSNNLKYFSTPTPGAANGNSSINGLAASVHFSVPHGFFNAPFTLLLTTPTGGATIRYTLDGSDPTLSNGLDYTNALTINKTTVVRAAAFKTNLLSSIVDTRTYLFVESILQQPAAPAGYPTGNVWTPTPGSIVNGSRAYYQMDQKVVTNALYSNVIRQALVDIPTLSVASSIDGIFGAVNGIYSHPNSRGAGWERPCSMEIIYPDGSSSGMQLNCGLQIQGGSSRDPAKNAKHSFRLNFKNDYGSGKLDWPLYSDTNVREYDRVDIDGGINYWWHYVGTSGPEDQRQRAQCVRDQYVADLQVAMGWPSFHGKFYHLYVNGLYWGLQYLHDRTDESWAESYLGGQKSDYQVVKITTGPFQIVAGDPTATTAAWNNMMNLANAGLVNNAQYEAIQQYMDMDNFIDFFILHLWAANTDWPHHNWYAVRNKNAGPGTAASKWQFIVWDAEHVLKSANDTGKFDATDANTPGQLWAGLRNNSEFRIRVGDRLHKHVFNGGALYVDPANPIFDSTHPERNRPAAVYMKRITEVTNAIVAESARWAGYYGATAGVNTNYTRNDHWLRDLNSLLGIANQTASFNFLPNRSSFVVTQFRNRNLYPTINSVAFSQFGGRVSAGYQLYMTNLAGGGTIYYTTDGVDPRVYSSGAVSASAKTYTNGVPVVLNSTATVKARVLSNTVWSALTEATFTVGGLGVPLRVTELMYNPSGGSAFEFLELQNVGGSVLDLGGYYFDGIGFTFPAGTMVNPGDRIVLGSAANTNAWRTRYGAGVVVAGWFSGALRDSGEKISIFDSHDVLVLTVDFQPGGGWPAIPSSGGYSIEIIDPNGDPDDPSNWRLSAGPNGTPGLAPAVVPPALVVLNEVMADNVAAVNNGGTYPDWVELYNSGATSADLGGWSLTDDGNARKFVFPPNTMLASSNYLVVWCDTNSAAPGLHTGFLLDRQADDVFLYDANTNRIDAIAFGLQIPDRTIGRVGPGVLGGPPAWQLTTPTPGAANVAAALDSVTNISINEWLADAPPGGSDWLELYNRSATAPVPLQNIYLANSNVLFQLHALSFLPPGGYIQLFADEAVGPDHLDFKLNKSGDAIILFDPTGVELTRVTFGAQSEGVSQGRLPDGAANIVSFPGTVSPGASNYVITYTGPRLNEILARNVRAVTNAANGGVSDWVEIFNPGGTSFDLTGWSLAVDEQSVGQWYFPTGFTLASQAYAVVWCDGSRPVSYYSTNLNTGRSISSESSGAYLFNNSGQLVDSVRFGFQVADLSIGRSASDWRLLSAPTSGATNAAPATLGSVQSLRINEWMAAPLSGDDWFELYNLDPLPVELSGIFLTDDPTLAGQTNSVAAPLSFIGGNGWVQWKADGQLANGLDHVAFSLDALGETLRIYSSSKTLIDVVDFGIQVPDVSQGRLVDGSATIVSFPIPTPGEGNYLPLTSVVINEALTHTDPPFEDAIELFNPNLATVNVGGWFLSNSRSDLKKYRIPNGTNLTWGSFAVFYESQFNANNPGTPFTLNSARGDEIWLSAADGGGNLTGYRTSVSFGPAANAVSFGRFDTSLGSEFTAMSQRTFGADNPASVTEFRTGAGRTNSPPKIGPVVINEIMYHPADIGGSDNSTDEFIELLNISDATVLLYDPAHDTNTWRLQAGIEFTFPLTTSIASGEYILVVNFDPALEPSVATAFRNKYGVAGGVRLFGPYKGKLDNGGEAVELAHPDAPQTPPHPDAGLIPYILVDRVAYSDSVPWPSAADGNTNALMSLQKRLPSLYGNEPLNWGAAATTAGATNNPAYLAAPTITLQPQDRGGVVGATITFTVGATGPGPLSYQWFFNGRPVYNATNSSLVIEGLQLGNEGSYFVFVANPAGAVLSSTASLAVQAPPSISQPPQTQVVSLGSPVTLNVVATGGGLSYRWLFYGANLSGATSNILSIASMQSGNIGPYSVVVSNISGVVTSQVAYLVVNAPSISADPQSQRVHVGDNVSLIAGFSGDQPLSYEWRKNGAPVPGGTNATLNFPSVQLTNGGNYALVISNPAGSVTSAVATISFYVTIAQQPQSLNVRPPTNVTFSVSAVGTGTLFYQWRYNGTNIDAATSTNLVVNNVQLTNAGAYSVVVTDDFGSVTSSNAILNVLVNPLIVQQPTAQAAMQGQSATFTVAVTNATLPIGYQWLKAPSTVYTNFLLYATNSTFTIANVLAADAGNFRVVCTNIAGTNNSSFAALMVGPGITAQPTNRIVNAGSNTTFTVVANGSATLRYQWRLFGTNLIGSATQLASYSLTNVQLAHAGDYSVVVTNNVGAVTSQVAVLTVRQMPAIVSEPQDQTVAIGTPASFSVGATGSDLIYQWLKDGPLSGETNPTLSIASAQQSDAGGYFVIITNVLGSVTSRVATLTVVLPPTLSAPQMLSAGEFQMLLTGQTNRDYDVQFTTNWLDWSFLKTISYSNGSMPILDTTATNSPNRVYRVLLR